jgi:hypothetical protein
MTLNLVYQSDSKAMKLFALLIKRQFVASMACHLQLERKFEVIIRLVLLCKWREYRTSPGSNVWYKTQRKTQCKMSIGRYKTSKTKPSIRM